MLSRVKSSGSSITVPMAGNSRLNFPAVSVFLQVPLYLLYQPPPKIGMKKATTEVIVFSCATHIFALPLWVIWIRLKQQDNQINNYTYSKNTARAKIYYP